MITFEGIEENLKFLVLETEKLVTSTREFLDAPDPSEYERIIASDDYIDNLKNIVENQCYSRINSERGISKRDVNVVRAMHIIGINLERIADNCINIIEQTQYLDDHDYIHKFNYKALFDELLTALSKIIDVMRQGSLAGALAVCRSEHEIDVLYKKDFDRIMNKLRSGRNVQNLITVLFIYRYLERMGDSMLNVGEALIFSIIGEKIKIHQFQSLQQNLSKTGMSGHMSDLDFQSFWGTRSGCRISRVEHRSESENPAQESIFKEGAVQKIEKEKESLERWNKVAPGLTPKVLSYTREKDKASMLVQFLPGCTFDEALLNMNEYPMLDAFEGLKKVVRQVWDKTMEQSPVPIDYISQLRERLDQIREIHPNFIRFEQKMGSAKIDSSNKLFEACSKVEKNVLAPFTVMIHGDFNVSNVIYDHVDNRVYYIDLHRSLQSDYVQDVSVFLISNFRIPVFNDNLRDRINLVIEHFYDFAEGYAEEMEDKTFYLRMALALARSLYTSTRFELNFKFAKEMFLRSHYLMEKIATHDGRGGLPEDFSLPEAVLYY